MIVPFLTKPSVKLSPRWISLSRSFVEVHHQDAGGVWRQQWDGLRKGREFLPRGSRCGRGGKRKLKFVPQLWECLYLSVCGRGVGSGDKLGL
ncbi:hypothetical protein BaRGS_00012208 [Batillaria attramentaria]|uniref:Uncharacterized protein n=1 Tax=Batillaria attramentaria TaxID=370345 RepID=A0ABD0LAG6_9CAEN